MAKELKQIIVFTIIGFLIGMGYLYFSESLSFQSAEKPADNPDVVQAGIDDRDRQLALTNNEITNSRQNAITRAIEAATPAVVSINVKSLQYRRPTSIFDMFERRAELVPSVGSGFIISEDGFIVTNQHVIENAREIAVILPSGERFLATKVGEDVQTDIALIKLQDVSRPLPTVQFGNSDDLVIGEWAIAIGNPFGLNEINNAPTVTLGIISAVNRDFGHITGDKKVYHEMIQTDASINTGNSGGPLLNAIGEVIGMNTIIYTGGAKGSVGLAFSIPSRRIQEIVEMLKSGDINRNVYTGIDRVVPITARTAYQYDLPVKEGILIYSIHRNSPADVVGLKPGDIIIEANNYKIKNFNNLQEAIKFSGLIVGDDLTMKVIRENKEQEFTLTLGSLK